MPASQSGAMLTFTLPPPALAETSPQHPGNLDAAVPAARSKKRRTAASTQQLQKSSIITLPPPPTRTRKIIQMKPAPPTSPTASGSTTSSTSPSTTTSKPAPKSKAKSTTTPAPPTTTSRKVARKTAHSLIERRRRSKMNAEFEALKNLVPACNGVEMHKLAILQASIEYVRYLEGCVQELQSGGRACSAPPPVFSTMAEEDEEEEEEDEEMEMEPTEDTSRRNSSFEQQQQQQLSERSSPVSQLQQTLPAPPHRNSYPDEYPSYTTTPSSAASPAFSAINSATTSPIFTFPSNSSLRLPSISPLLFPQHYTNENSPGALEATGAGALLLLADEGRRESYTASSWNSIQSVASRPRTGSVSTRGMNVRDLLSS